MGWQRAMLMAPTCKMSRFITALLLMGHTGIEDAYGAQQDTFN
jgi:hypothetical protein